METFEGFGSVRTEPAPRRTKKCYKLMRLVNGKLYPLYIDRAEPVKLGVWYNADSPDFEFLKTLPAGYHLIEGENTLVESRDEKPSKSEVLSAIADGRRWMWIELCSNAQKRFFGESRRYWNLGVNGSNSVGKYSMRPGWHAGSLPVMRQVGKGANKDLCDDSFVFVEGEISADIDYNAEAQRNPENDLPDKMPVDGWYLKATNANKKAAQADRVGWYIAGAIKLNRIISDSEAHAIIDRYNAQHPDDEPVQYHFPRESGRMFNADTMSLEGLQGTKKAKQPTNEGKYIDDERHKFFMRLITKGRVKVETAQELSLMLVNAMVEISQWKKRQYENPENTTDSLLFQNRMAAHDIVTRITGDLLDKGVRVKSVEAVCDMIMDCLVKYAQWKDQQHEAVEGLQGSEQPDEPFGTKNKKVIVNGEPITIRYRGYPIGEPYNVRKLRYGQSFDQDFSVFINGKYYTAVRHWTNNGGGYSERWTYNSVPVSSEKKLAELILSTQGNSLQGGEEIHYSPKVEYYKGCKILKNLDGSYSSFTRVRGWFSTQDSLEKLLAKIDGADISDKYEHETTIKQPAASDDDRDRQRKLLKLKAKAIKMKLELMKDDLDDVKLLLAYLYKDCFGRPMSPHKTFWVADGGDTWRYGIVFYGDTLNAFTFHQYLKTKGLMPFINYVCPDAATRKYYIITDFADAIRKKLIK